MAFQFNQTGAEIQDILDQVPVNTSDITTLTSAVAALSDVKSGGSACGLTAQTGVTITKAYKLKVGRLVMYTLQISVTTSATAANLITGFEQPIGGVNGSSGFFRAVNNSSTSVQYYLYLSESGVLRTPSVTSAADLRFTFSYITAS